MKALKVVDLSYPWGSKDMVVSHYAEGQPVYVPREWGRNNPWNALDRRDYRLEITNWMYADGTNCPDVTLWSHAGTHIETPGYHMVNPPKSVKDKGIADYPPDEYFGEAAVIDLTPFSRKYGINLPEPDFSDPSSCIPSYFHPAKQEGKGATIMTPFIQFSIPKYELKPLLEADYKELDKKVKKGDILLAFNRIGGISLDVNWVIEKGIKMVAPQNMWFHGTRDGMTIQHDILLGNGIPIIEGIRNIDKLKRDRVFFIGMPWHLLAVGASPIWAIAIEDFDYTPMSP